LRIRAERLLDGGTTVLWIEREGGTKVAWLKSKCYGEPRPLMIDDVRISKGDPKVIDLIKDIEEWWLSVPEETKASIASRRVRPVKGPHSPLPEISIENGLSMIKSYLSIDEALYAITVRDYAASHYLE
jgi:hypothetical protein